MYKNTIKVVLPFNSKVINIPEISNKDLINLNKAIEGDSDNAIVEFFDYHVFEKNRDLDIVERFFILLLLRIKFIGNNIELNLVANDTNRSTSVKFYLDDILELFKDIKYEKLKPIKVDDYIFNVGVPKNLYYNNYKSLLLEIIKSIKYKNVKVVYEKDELLDNLDKKILVKLLETMAEEFNKELLNIFLLKNSGSFKNLTDLRFNIFSNNIYYFIKLIYKFPLDMLYDKLFILAYKLNFGYSDFCEITPLETDILLNKLKALNRSK